MAINAATDRALMTDRIHLTISAPMILVTGGAGFIGSNLHAALWARGTETVLADRLREGDKWRNLRHHPPTRLIDPDDLVDFLDTYPPLEAIIHLGAISETTARDGDLVWRNNVALSQTLWDWCANHGVPFLYASSAATYGDGRMGFDDATPPALLRQFAPLNLYGWSKHAFDLWALAQVAAGKAPPHWAGLKFFNVYGPNEYHKGPMVSVVKVKHDELRAGKPITLFRSDQPTIPDGAQQRDFIWIDDVINIMLHLLDASKANGLFNVGTGTARSYLDLACAVCAAHQQAERIEFVPMPARLIGQYQSFTEANITRLRASGYTKPFTTLEAGIARYIQEFLTQTDPYR